MLSSLCNGEVTTDEHNSRKCLLKKGFHHILHLEEQRCDLLVIVAPLQVQLDDNSECADSDFEQGSERDTCRYVQVNVLPMNGCNLATSSKALIRPGRLSTSALTPLRIVFIASLSYADFSGEDML